MALTTTLSQKRSDALKPGELYQDFISLASLNGQKALVAAQTGKQIQVVALTLASSKASKFLLQSANDTIAQISFAGAETLVFSGAHYDSIIYATSKAEALNITCTDSPTAAGVYVQYRYRDID